jgi:hypothetical protein
MNLKRFDTIYVHGCSHTAGGGLYEKYAKRKYKELFNLEWETERDVNFPSYLGKHFDCKLIDKSMCGSGAPRLVRETFDYIFKVGIEKVKKTLFIFQINTPVHRLDYYCNEIENHLIVNVQYNDDGSFKYFNTVDSHSPNETKYGYDYFKEKINKDLEYHVKNYHDPFIYLQKIHNELWGLFSFLELNNIEYFFGFDTGNNIRPVNEERRINIDGVDTINKFTNDIIKGRLMDELPDCNDGHPGYFGHKIFGEKLIDFLEQKLKPTLWIFGDSYSSKSTPDYGPEHSLYKNDFRVKYANFKGYYPKHFPEIVSEELGLNLVNVAVPSTSNDQIFHSFINVMDEIKPNDILFFGWTYVSRYNVANKDNDLENISIPREGDISFVDDLSSNSLNEILYNRGSHTIFYKLLSNYIKIINKSFNKCLILHSDFFDHGVSDEYVNEYKNFLIKRKDKYETIYDETKGERDIHYSEKGHKNFANDVIKLILSKNQTLTSNRQLL